MCIVYYLSSCSTCKRILTELPLPATAELQEIKTNPLSEKQLVELYNMTNSYEALFNKRARLYKSLDLKNKKLSEQDYKAYLLKEYTFLKRPVIKMNQQVFIGNSKKTVEAAKQALYEK